MTAASMGVIVTVWLVASLLFGPGVSSAWAEALDPVLRATDEARAVHVVLNMRTRSGEDFPYVDLRGEMMRVTAWIEQSGTGAGGGRARIEKQDRAYTFDGQQTVLYLTGDNEAYRVPGRALDLHLFWPADWVRRVRDLPPAGIEVVEHVESGGSGRLLLRQKGADTSPREPAFLGEFDRETELEWDLATKRLSALRRWVFVDGRRVLFSETESIEYLPGLDAATFRPDLPDDVRWGGVRPGGIELLELGPREAAQRLFDAASDGDRETLSLLCPSPRMVDWLLDNPPSKVYYLGEPFRTGKYVGVYVPYKVRFGSDPGRVREHNLALRNDNPENRWVWDGGI